MPLDHVDLTLDKPRRLRYDFNAIADLETTLGHPIATLLTTQMGLSSIRGLLWCGLKAEDRRLTPQRTGELIQQYLTNGGTLEALLAKVREALDQSGVFGLGGDHPLASSDSS